MNKIFRNLSLMLAAGALAVSCADYNVTDDFKADPDPSVVEPYKDYAPVKSYINREQYGDRRRLTEASAPAGRETRGTPLLHLWRKRDRQIQRSPRVSGDPPGRQPESSARRPVRSDG